MFVDNRRGLNYYYSLPRPISVNQYNYTVNEGLSGIGSFFKKIGTSLGRVFSAGLWDPSKNRFFVPFSSGHVRTFGKGFTTLSTGGLVNADKFFDSRTMRTIGTVVGATGAALTGTAAIGAVAGSGFSVTGGLGVLQSGGSSLLGGMKSIGGMFGGGSGLMKSVGSMFGGGGGGLFSSGMQLISPFLQRGGGQQIEQVPQQQEIVQTNYPLPVSPVGIYPPYYYNPNYVQPYSYNPNVERGYYQYKDGNLIGPIESPSIKPTVEEIRERRELLPGGVDVFTINGIEDVVDSWGSVVRY